MRFVLEQNIPLDIWRELKKYLVHDIKTQGQHLKKNKSIINYNAVMREVPRIYAMASEPMILYQNRASRFEDRCKKFLYCRIKPSAIKNKILKSRDKYSLIIEVMCVFPVDNSVHRLKSYFDKIDCINYIKDFR